MTIVDNAWSAGVITLAFPNINRYFYRLVNPIRPARCGFWSNPEKLIRMIFE